jgi:hypothetical protein
MENTPSERPEWGALFCGATPGRPRRKIRDSKLAERGIRTPDASQENTNEYTGKDTGISVVLGHDLSRVVTAWDKLPPPLKAAILAIVDVAGK